MRLEQCTPAHFNPPFPAVLRSWLKLDNPAEAGVQLQHT